MKKFTNNDIFYNSLITNPKFKIIMQSGSLRINDQINQNNEFSSSISGIDYPGTYTFKTYTGSHAYSSSISREFIYANPTNAFNSTFTKYASIKKIAALKNIFQEYKQENEFADIKYYISDDGIPNRDAPVGFVPSPNSSPKYFIIPTASINLIEIPRDFYGNYIKPGSVTLNMYVSGALSASAGDIDKTGKLIQTYGSGSGNIIGSIFYDHGILLLTGSYSLNTQQSSYIQPLDASTPQVNDYLKWIYFGSYQAPFGSSPETKYELIFQGTNYIPTLTMFCHAEKGEFFWSNNRTFLEADQGDEIFIGQSTSSVNLSGNVYYADSGSILVPSNKILQENKLITIKNTISSSFTHYSASYEPQTFISQIGIYDEYKNLIAIAKVANPVKKMKDSCYTFKLKLDF